MTETIPGEIQTTLEEILSQMTRLTERVALLEGPAGESAKAANGRDHAPVAAPAKAIPSVAVEAGISEEELIAISAAVAAYLGVRAHIRQIRVIHSTGAWAQQGRVSVQASHRLLY